MVEVGELACVASLQGDLRFDSMGVAGILGSGRSWKQGTDMAPCIEKPCLQRNHLWTSPQRDDGIRIAGILRSPTALMDVKGDLTVHAFPLVDVRHGSTEIIPNPCGERPESSSQLTPPFDGSSSS